MQLPSLDPTRASSVTDLRVRFCETDMMGIVHHAQYLAYFEAGRVEWLRRRGLTYAGWTADEIHLPVVEATLRYRSPARFDELLSVETRLVELRWASVRYAYSIRHESRLLAEGETRLACVDGSHTLRRIPLEFLTVLASGELDAPGAAGSV